MSDVHENDAGQSADQKNDVKPAMIEAELKIAENLRYDHSVLSRHVHSHQQHRGNKVHSLFYFEYKILVNKYCKQEAKQKKVNEIQP